MPVINLLQCPLCLCSMKPPVYCCSQGHDMCSVCRNAHLLCPVCGDCLSGERNWVAEQLALRLPYPCPNDGCPESPTFAQMPRHQAVCPYRLYQCIPCKPRCQWRGYRESILQHMREEHPEMVWPRSYKNMIYENFNIESEYLCTNVIATYGRLFWHISHRDVERNSFYEIVQLVGPPEHASDFRFVVELYSQGRPEKSLSLSCNVQPEHEDYLDGEYVSVRLSVMKEFVNERKQVFCSLRIEFLEEHS